MDYVDREFPRHVQESIATAKRAVRERFGLAPGNNVDLICTKLDASEDGTGAYVECGVFRGNTLFTVATFLRAHESGRGCYGLDTFQGFPEDSLDERDRPHQFSKLFEEGRITADHLEKARTRVESFAEDQHLGAEYFAEVGDVFRIGRSFDNVRLIEGPFGEGAKQIDEPIAVLFLDCDLYRSYLEALESLYPRVVVGGAVIFDEYYSLKYPGARIAVDEFLAGRPGTLERYVTDDGFERWCFMKG